MEIKEIQNLKELNKYSWIHNGISFFLECINEDGKRRNGESIGTVLYLDIDGINKLETALDTNRWERDGVYSISEDMDILICKYNLKLLEFFGLSVVLKDDSNESK